MEALEGCAHPRLADARLDRLGELIALLESEVVGVHAFIIGAAVRGRLMQVKPVPPGSARMAP